MIKDKTGVQLNQGHTSTDDFITRKYVLPLLRDEKIRNRLVLVLGEGQWREVHFRVIAVESLRVAFKGDVVAECAIQCEIFGVQRVILFFAFFDQNFVEVGIFVGIFISSPVGVAHFHEGQKFA